MNTELKAHYLQVLSKVKIPDQINDTFHNPIIKCYIYLDGPQLINFALKALAGRHLAM